MAVRIIQRKQGNQIISGKEIMIDAAGGAIVTATDSGQVVSKVSGGEMAGEVNYDLNNVAYRRNGVSPDGSRAGDWKSKPNVDVDGVI